MRKKNNLNKRPYINYREFNDITIRDIYSLFNL